MVPGLDTFKGGPGALEVTDPVVSKSKPGVVRIQGPGIREDRYRFARTAREH